MYSYHPLPLVITTIEAQSPRRFIHISLSVPDLLDGAGESDILGLELIETVESNGGSSVQQVQGVVVHGAVDSLGDVVGNARLETKLGVDQKSSTESGVQNGRDGAGGEGQNGHGDEADHEDSLKGPVVGALGGVGGGDGRGVVDGADNASGGLGDGAEHLVGSHGDGRSHHELGGHAGLEGGGGQSEGGSEHLR